MITPEKAVGAVVLTILLVLMLGMLVYTCPWLLEWRRKRREAMDALREEAKPKSCPHGILKTAWCVTCDGRKEPHVEAVCGPCACEDCKHHERCWRKADHTLRCDGECMGPGGKHRISKADYELMRANLDQRFPLSDALNPEPVQVGGPAEEVRRLLEKHGWTVQSVDVNRWDNLKTFSITARGTLPGYVPEPLAPPPTW